MGLCATWQMDIYDQYGNLISAGETQYAENGGLPCAYLTAGAYAPCYLYGWGCQNPAPSNPSAPQTPGQNGAPNNGQKKGLFTCASEAGAQASLANALHMIPGLKSGVGGFVADAVGGNAFSGATDLIQSIATGEGGGHSVFYNMAQGVVAGPTQGFGSAFGKAIEGTPWSSGPMDAAMGATLGEYASGIGELKLAYDAGSYAMGLFQCATGIIH
jgi:hypothetical protein